jgi:biopolymer transport protein ExbB
MTDVFLSAIAAATTTTEAVGTVWDFLLGGGLFMIPLVLTSVVGLMAILYKFLSLSRRRVVPGDLARRVAAFEELAAAERLDPLLREFEAGHSTLARLGQVAVKHRGRPQADIVLAVESAARVESSRLHAGIGVLDIVITVAPLLGLLGTASGLVTIFQGLGSNPDQTTLARGIAIALNTTIVGLAIAVPCVIAHGYFTRRIEVLTATLEALLADLANACQKLRPRA